MQQLEPDLSAGSRVVSVPRRSSSLDDARCLNALRELDDSEHAYLADLRTLADLLALADDDGTVARNLAELIGLHARLCDELDDVDAQLDWRHDNGVALPVDSVARIYIDAAPAFASYEEYCAGHMDAVEKLRTVDWQTAGRDRLQLADYLIKPIQRICRYGLLLDSIACTLPTGQREVIDRATSLLRIQAAGAEGARHMRDLDRRTVLVARRIELPPAAQPAFLAFLGQLQLLGTLQVIHTGPDAGFAQSETRVKYYGALLYPSHILFVKPKRADSYEPRQWLPLRMLELSEEQGLLPHSFQLLYGSHRFEISAATDEERQLWLQRLKTAQAECRALRLSTIAANPVAEPFDDSLVCSLGPLPDDDGSGSQVHNARLETSATGSVRQRLSSTASLLLGRAPAAVRATVDMRLADVFSDECLIARTQRSVPRRSRSFVSIESAPTSASSRGHRRRMSADVWMLGGSKMASEPPPSISRRPSQSSIAIRSKSSDGARLSLDGSGWAGAWRRSRASLSQISLAATEPGLPTSPIEELSLDADAIEAAAQTGVERNLSTSSSSSSALITEPRTPSPFPTSSPPGAKWLATALTALSPPAVHDEQAMAAEAFLRSADSGRSYLATVKESWRKRRASLGGQAPPPVPPKPSEPPTDQRRQPERSMTLPTAPRIDTASRPSVPRRRSLFRISSRMSPIE